MSLLHLWCCIGCILHDMSGYTICCFLVLHVLKKEQKKVLYKAVKNPIDINLEHYKSTGKKSLCTSLSGTILCIRLYDSFDKGPL